ncbi:MAG: YhcH/YjgK/YiaL family protein [Pelobium sp.]
MKKLIVANLLAVLILTSCAINKSQSWFKKQNISQGLMPIPAPETNKDEFAKQYTANKAVWDKAFEWMKSQDLNALAVGKYPIDGDNAYASITEIIDKPLEDTKWESHKKYIDLQYIISGAEKIGISPTVAGEVINPYTDAKDVMNYKIDDAKFVTATPKAFYLFFPADAHRPNIKVNEEKVKKLVIKIHVAE